MAWAKTTNWEEVLPLALTMRKDGKTFAELAKHFNCNQSNIANRLRKLINESEKPIKGKPTKLNGLKTSDPQDETNPSDSLPVSALGKSASELEKARFNARKLLSNAVSGIGDPSAQQIAAARLLLAGELEPAEDVNPYAGILEEELAERAIVCACSVLGVDVVQMVLDRLRHEGQADALGRPGEIPAEALATIQADPALVAQAEQAGETHAPLTLDDGTAEGLEGMATEQAAPAGEATPAPEQAVEIGEL